MDILQVSWKSIKLYSFGRGIPITNAKWFFFVENHWNLVRTNAFTDSRAERNYFTPQEISPLSRLSMQLLIFHDICADEEAGRNTQRNATDTETGFPDPAHSRVRVRAWSRKTCNVHRSSSLQFTINTLSYLFPFMCIVSLSTIPITVIVNL